MSLCSILEPRYQKQNFNIKYGLIDFTIRTVNCVKALRLNPYRRRLSSEVTFVNVLRNM